MKKAFTPEDLQNGRIEVLSKGRWANADLLSFQNGGATWVIKDFSACPWLVRHIYGRFMINRELRALKRLKGIKGFPEKAFSLHKFALCYHYIPGRTLKESKRQRLDSRYFLELERLVKEMHERNVVHLDIRYMRNILVTEDGTPALLDFQSSLLLDRLPRSLHQILKDVDISGVYKCWQKRCPQPMDRRRLEFLKSMEKRRSFWVFKGYPFGTRRPRRF